VHTAELSAAKEAAPVSASSFPAGAADVKQQRMINLRALGEVPEPDAVPAKPVEVEIVERTTFD
jgi:hypothetical protein